MSPRRKYAPVERARWLLLVTLLVVVAAVALAYLVRRPGADEQRRPARRLLEASDGEMVLAGEGFEYEHVEGDRRVYRVQAQRIVSSRDGRIGLEQIRLEVNRDEGGPIVTTSNRAIYQLDGSVARLEGEVHVAGADGFELRSGGLELARNGTVLTSTTPVSFALGEGYRGSADGLFYHLKRERLRLSGKVRIQSAGDAATAAERLACDELVVERPERLVRAEGNVVLRRGDSLLRAKRLSLTFAADEKTLEFARASWEVSGSMRSESGADMGTTTTFSSDQLSLVFRGERVEKAELEGTRGRRVKLAAVDDGGLRRELEAPYLVGDFVGGRPAIVRGYEGAELRESLELEGGAPLRRACGEWILAGFDPLGELEELVLQNDVDYQQAGLHATGERVRVAASGEATLTGDLARLSTDRGLLEAPRIRYSASPEAVRALEGVRAEIPEGGRFSLIGEAKRGPVRLSSREAAWSGTPAEFSFEGDVRAWQGENYLLAEKLTGDRGGDRLLATGKVKTVLRPEPEEETGGEEAQPLGRAPIEVTADRLTYERPQRLLTYSGAVVARETGRTLKCLDLEAELGERDRFDRLTCHGTPLVLENPKDGHTLQGEKAIYEPALKQVEISGAPVVMRDREGSILRGPVVIYDLETGVAQVRSRPRPDTKPAGDAPS